MTRQTAKGLLPEVLKPFDRFATADRHINGIAHAQAGQMAPGRLDQLGAEYWNGRAA